MLDKSKNVITNELFFTENIKVYKKAPKNGKKYDKLVMVIKNEF